MTPHASEVSRQTVRPVAKRVRQLASKYESEWHLRALELRLAKDEEWTRDMPSLKNDIPDAVRIAVGHVNVSARVWVNAADFAQAVAGRKASAGAKHAVASFLDEADPAEIADVVACGATNFVTIAEIARAVLPPNHPNRLYLDELAPRETG